MSAEEIKALPKALQFVDIPQGDAYGPFSNPALAQIVLKIVHLVIDEEATLENVDLNPHEAELMAGLKPFLISIESSNGQVTGNEIKLTWPPYDSNCKVEERVGFVSYFVWAKTQGEAVKVVPSLAGMDPVKPDYDLKEIDFPQETEELEA